MGEILQIIREVIFGWKPREAARLMNVRLSYVIGIETGRKKLSLEDLAKFGEIYDIPSYQFLIFQDQKDLHQWNRKQTMQMILGYYLEKEQMNEEKEFHFVRER